MHSYTYSQETLADVGIEKGGKMCLICWSLYRTKEKKWIQLGKHKEPMSFRFLSFSLFSTSGLRLNNEIVKYSGLNIYLRAFAFSHIN